MFIVGTKLNKLYICSKNVTYLFHMLSTLYRYRVQIQGSDTGPRYSAQIQGPDTGLRHRA